MQRDAQRFYYVIADSQTDKRKGNYSYALVVGADYYVRGTMLRYIYASSKPVSELLNWGIWGNHPDDANTTPYVMATYLREHGKRVTVEQAATMFPALTA